MFLSVSNMEAGTAFQNSTRYSVHWPRFEFYGLSLFKK